MDKKVKLFGFTITKSVTPEVAALQSDIKYLKEEREELLDMISKLDTKINEYDVKKYDEIKKLKEAKDKEYKELQYNTDLALKRKDGEIDLLRAEDSKQYTKQIATLEWQLAKAQAEVSAMETAFKELGYSVKDMSSVFGKLTDALVAKQAINVIK